VVQRVAIVGIGLVPVQKQSPVSLRDLGRQAVSLALSDASVDRVDALYLGNMLADELSGQKHLASLVASHAGLAGVEALHCRAATASGAAALRVAFLAVSSGQVELAMAAGVELMSGGPPPMPALSRALDALREIPNGLTMIEANAHLMSLYLQRYRIGPERLTNFAVNAHRNSVNSPYALYRKTVDAETVNGSRIISPPLRLYDCSPICDGAAAVVVCRPKGRAVFMRLRFRFWPRPPLRTGSPWPIDGIRWHWKVPSRRPHGPTRWQGLLLKTSISLRFTMPSASWPACNWRLPALPDQERVGEWRPTVRSFERAGFPSALWGDSKHEAIRLVLRRSTRSQR
jgi:acetyl-CoA acetyltransferase